MSNNHCDLCGLSLQYGNFSLEISGRGYRFCCMGCKQVFRILLEASDSGDPSNFKDSDLFKQCQAAGIIPVTETELKRRSLEKAPAEKAAAAADMRSDAPLSGASAAPHRLLLQLQINNMWCPACAWVIDQTLLRSPGVSASVCHFTTDRLRCEYDPVKTSPARILEAIEKLGYRAALPGEDNREIESRREMLRFGISAFLAMNVMMLSFALYSGFFSRLDPDAVTKLSWPIFGLATVVLVYGGQNIFRRAFSGFFSAAASMETLIAIGAAAAYALSVYNFAHGEIHLYFDTAAMLIVLVLLGKMLERRARNKIQEDLEHFFSLKPAKVRRCTPEFPEGRYVAADSLQAGDVIRVEAGEIVPADGPVIEGCATIDESSLTGEAVPLRIETGRRIRSGTRIQEGTLKIKAQVVGESTTLGQMIQIIENALARKTPLEGKTDRLLIWFVPAVLLLAVGTALGCYLSGLSPGASILRAVTVLVISCPCALGIAIPLARVAGISTAGKRGLLVRDFSAFEQADQVNTFVFDKTGTITRGHWQLIDVIPTAGFSRDRILSLAAALEAESDHPVGLAIKQRAVRERAKSIALTGITFRGNGISARYGNAKVKIGSAAFLSDEIKSSEHNLSAGVETGQIHSRVFLAYDRRIIGIFVFGDTLREGVDKVVSKLQARGHRLVLVSGDSVRVTREVAQQVGISDAHGQFLPHEKAALIDDFKGRGLRVAMIGDGINDAPAMAVSNLAMAVHSGSHLGKEVADVTLMRGEPLQILDFLQLAAQTNRKVAQNLWCSFIYNIVAIPVAISGLLNPLVAVCAMLLSSLTVIGNTLLLVKRN